MNQGGAEVTLRAKNKGTVLPESLKNGDVMDVSEATVEVTNGTAPSAPAFVPPRPRPFAVVAVEEDDEDIIPGPPSSNSNNIGKASSFSKLFGNSSGKSSPIKSNSSSRKEQARPVDPSASRSRHVRSEEMDISLTEHHIKGNGILASRADLDVAPEEFAAGCKKKKTVVAAC